MANANAVLHSYLSEATWPKAGNGKKKRNGGMHNPAFTDRFDRRRA